jgi:hypothetical protein
MSRNVMRTLAVAAVVVLAAATAATAHAATLDQVRHSTAPFQQLNAAKAAGYGLLTDAAGIHCISDPSMGAMGVHYVNGDLVGDGVLDAQQPEALLYESSGGRLKLLGVEYIVIAETWDANNPAPPTLGGQVFHLTGSPNRFGLPPFYSLHVWAWKANANGTFSDWNPKVSCDDFTPAAAPGGSGHGMH